MYSIIEFQIEVPEKMNELRNNSMLGIGVNTKLKKKSTK